VDAFIRQRDTALREREVRLRETEGKVDDLQAQLQQREQALDRLKQELDSMGTDSEVSSHEYASRLTASFMTEELQKVLGAAQEAATRIIERADLTTQERIAEAGRLWRDVEAELSKLASWYEVFTPATQSTQSTIEEARAEIQDVPERIRQALVPMADAIAGVQAQIDDLALVAALPALLEPEILREILGNGQGPAGEGTEVPGAPDAGGDEGRADPEATGADAPEATAAGPIEDAARIRTSDYPWGAPTEAPAGGRDPGPSDDPEATGESSDVGPMQTDARTIGDEAGAAEGPEVTRLPEAEPQPTQGDEALPSSRAAALGARDDDVGSVRGDDAEGEGGARVLPLPEAGSDRPRRRSAWRWIAAAVVLLLIAASGVVGYALANRTPSDESRFTAFLSETGTHLVAFTPSSGQQLSVAFQPGQRQAWIVGRGLPAPSHRQVYELWYFPAGSEQPHPGGTFVPDHGTVLEPITLGPSVATLAVTVEPAGGSKQPTSKPIFVVNV
jgi:hypothetical protein